MLWASVGTTLLMVAVNLIAWAAGWWVGPVFELSALPVLTALTVLAGVPACCLWLGGYRWLAVWFRRPLLAYAAVVIAFIPGVWVIDQWQMERNQFKMAAGYELWHDMLLGQIVLWVPVLLYEGLRRSTQLDCSK